MGGSDDESNLVILTIEEHAEEHRRLYEEHGCWQDYCAWISLSGQIPKAEINRLRSINRDTSYMQTPEYKAAHSAALKGRKATSGCFKPGMKRPTSAIEKQRATITGKPRGPYKKREEPVLEFRGKLYPSIAAARQDTRASFYTIKQRSRILSRAAEPQP